MQYWTERDYNIIQSQFISHIVTNKD